MPFSVIPGMAFFIFDTEKNVFQSLVIGTYMAHAILRDTDNQFPKPYRIGRLFIPPRLFHLMV